MAYSPFDLTGKVALVTGGNGGIGLGMAEALAQAGSGVVIWGTNEAKNKAAEATLRAHGGKVLAQKIDVADEAQVVAGMKDAVAQMGRVDAVFANAGHRFGCSLVSRHYNRAVPPGACGQPRRRLLHVARSGATYARARRERRPRRVAGRCGEPGRHRRCCPKSALRGDQGCRGLDDPRHCGGVRPRRRSGECDPAGLDCDRHDGEARRGSPKFAENVISRVPARRWGEPADFGGLAVYLASDASAYHSGDTLIVDGGYAVF